jgi:hypothetical protein
VHQNLGQSDVDHFVVTDADLGALAKPVQRALEPGERRVGIAPGTAACGAATGPKVFHGVPVRGRPFIRRNADVRGTRTSGEERRPSEAHRMRAGANRRVAGLGKDTLPVRGSTQSFDGGEQRRGGGQQGLASKEPGHLGEQGGQAFSCRSVRASAAVHASPSMWANRSGSH